MPSSPEVTLMLWGDELLSRSPALYLCYAPIKFIFSCSLLVIEPIAYCLSLFSWVMAVNVDSMSWCVYRTFDCGYNDLCYTSSRPKLCSTSLVSLCVRITTSGEGDSCFLSQSCLIRDSSLLGTCPVWSCYSVYSGSPSMFKVFLFLTSYNWLNWLR